ncbi:unnamed protein product, partial [Mesorhabditis spiculigera]
MVLAKPGFKDGQQNKNPHQKRIGCYKRASPRGRKQAAPPKPGVNVGELHKHSYQPRICVLRTKGRQQAADKFMGELQDLNGPCARPLFQSFNCHPAPAAPGEPQQRQRPPRALDYTEAPTSA